MESKIRFLEVVIEPNGIEIEKKKMDEVLSWPEPKNMKDVRKFLGLANYYSVRGPYQHHPWNTKPTSQSDPMSN